MVTESLSEFVDAMNAAGCNPYSAADIKPAGKWDAYKLHDDAGSKKRGYYRLTVDGDFVVGQFGDRRQGETHTWTSKTKRQWTPEEKAAWKARVESEKKAAEEERQVLARAAADDALARWNSAVPASPDHPYLARKKIEPLGIKQHGDILLVPMWYQNGTVNLQKITSDGEKLFLKNGRVDGAYYALTNRTESRDVIIIAEGFATAASIKMAFPDKPVICAFNAGNLLPVARDFRAKLPHARIVIAADDDAFTFKNPRHKDVADVNAADVAGVDPMWAEWLENGWLYNTGRDKATIAATKCNGYVIWPEFEALGTKPTDFNDLHVLSGIDAVRDRIAPALVAVSNPSATTMALVGDSVQRGGGDSFQDGPPLELYDDMAGYDGSYPANDDDDYTVGDFGMPFKVLGWSGNSYYYYSYAKQQVVSLTAQAHTSLPNLFQLAEYTEWGRMHEDTKVSDKDLVKFASNRMLALAHKKGGFNEEECVRGCGAWVDNIGRILLHTGDKVIVDGVAKKPKDVDGKLIFIAEPKRFKMAKEVLPDDEAKKLIKICSMPNWENPLTGVLLAGWIAIAPICGALPWRPHIYITGQALSGKSTVVNEILRRALGDTCISFGSSTTEAKLRSVMGSGALPIILDESEPKAGFQYSAVDGIIELARACSSGEKIGKFGQKATQARSMFCFTGINPQIKNFADATRISRFNISHNKALDARQKYLDMRLFIDQTLTPSYVEGFIKRVTDNIGIVLENIKVLREAIYEVAGDPRAADQMSAMLAGYFLLQTTRLITPEEAKTLAKKYEWSDHTAIKDDPDPIRLIQHIVCSLLRIPNDKGGMIDMTIGELIVSAVSDDMGMVVSKYAHRILRQHGIIARADGIFVSNSSKNLKGLLRNTSWEAGWKDMLKGLEGARMTNAISFLPGEKKTKAVFIPMSAFNDGDASGVIEEEIEL